MKSEPVTGQLIVVCGALLIYLETNFAGFKVITELECEFEISCIDITPIGKLIVVCSKLLVLYEKTRKIEKGRLEVL